ncbi:MAG TPA: TraB/GumN family protein [Burkholderiaceae bacterium]|nr:TraB/GumN family protein [Burkholderiaceae bacterium]
MTDPARRATVRTLLGLAAGASLPGCAYRSLPFADFQPALYRVCADSASCGAWLFGSIHIGLSRFYPLPEPVEQAWQSSRRLACEINAGQNYEQLREAFRARALLPEGQSLEHFIDEPTLTALRRHFGMGVHEWQSRLRLQPWALSTMLISQDDTRLAAQPGMGLDAYFLGRARALQRPIIELEELEEQVEALAGGSLTEQAAQLADRFRRIGEWDRPLSDIVDAWRRGDDARLAALKARSFGDGGRLLALRRRMFGERDERMARRLLQVMQAPGDVFALVGALHLVGEDSLQHALREQGATVERVRYGSAMTT